MKKHIKYFILIATLAISAPALADEENAINTFKEVQASTEQLPFKGFYLRKGQLKRYIQQKYGVFSKQEISSPIETNPLTTFEMTLPRGSQPDISRFEKFILSVYLDHPDDPVLTSYMMNLMIWKVRKTFYRKNQNSLLSPRAERFKYRIFLQYFTQRAIELGVNNRWVNRIARRNAQHLEHAINRKSGVDTSEGFEAQTQFLNSFNRQEELRYESSDALLTHFLKNPNNVMGAFLVTASSLWIGGEADADDPTTLYDYLVGAYVSLHTMKLSEIAERAWEQNPDDNERFRLASIVGGFSVSMRRWIAQLNGDTTAIEQLDLEHLEWVDINPIFHMFTYGLTRFEDDFPSAITVWNNGFFPCLGPDGLAAAGFRTCLDRPRFSFNAISITIGTIDMLLKAGQKDLAMELLNAVQFAPIFGFSEWTLGQESLLHRRANFDEIAALYQNGDPTDDPLPLNLKRRNWSAPTQTCQSCHQEQLRVWSDEEREQIVLHPEDILTIGTFPAVRTAWYGSSVPQ